MSRRRLSERQLARIRTVRERHQQRVALNQVSSAAALEDSVPQMGRVVVRHGANLAVANPEGKIVHCVCRQHIGYPVCGDQVMWQALDAKRGVIVELKPRTSMLSRPDATGRDKPLAANLDLLVVVIAPEPAPTGYLLDQYLVFAELNQLPAMILCNKMDLLTAEEQQRWLDALAHYQKIGYSLLAISTREETQVKQLAAQLPGTSLLVGQSGVGKSSLAAALLPDQAIQVGQLSKATGLGRHTTSATTAYRLPNGGYLIDSPGVRSFRLGALSRQELERGFREFAAYQGQCRFNDCRHQQEPDCALQAAVQSGAIAHERLMSFHQLVGVNP